MVSVNNLATQHHQVHSRAEYRSQLKVNWISVKSFQDSNQAPSNVAYYVALSDQCVSGLASTKTERDAQDRKS